MGFYPVFLELAGRRCLVVGGGLVAERRVHGLLAANAAVTVVSPALTPALGALASGGQIRHDRRSFAPDDLDGVDLAFAATDRGEVNAALSLAARARGVWVNAADDPAYCTFILPAVVRRGELSVAVSTGGTSPALARAIREELERYLTAEYVTLAEIAGRRGASCAPPGGSPTPRRGGAPSRHPRCGGSSSSGDARRPSATSSSAWEPRRARRVGRARRRRPRRPGADHRPRPRAPAARRRRRLRPSRGSAPPRRGATGAPHLRRQGARGSRATARADQRAPREARAARPARREAQGRRPLRLRPGR